MSPETSALLYLGWASAGATTLSILGKQVGDRTFDVMTEVWKKNIEDKARKMPPIVITQPTAPHIIDFDSP